MEQLCKNYEEWKHCITVKCGIPLSKAYVEQRIDALSNPKDPMTARFLALYGEDHREQTVGWFRQALAEL